MPRASQRRTIQTMNPVTREKGGTFSLNRAQPIHRWYPYIEGYSSCFVEEELHQLLALKPDLQTIYDPFGGTGTTALVASCHGIQPFYSESNPFMQQVIETKINQVRAASGSPAVSRLEYYAAHLSHSLAEDAPRWDGFEKFFAPRQLHDLLTLRAQFAKEPDPAVRALLFLALSAITVPVSRMIRRGDLRYATAREYQELDVCETLAEKLQEILADLREHGQEPVCPAVQVSEDARSNQYTDAFDCVITSPPYLNGTNYIRNTKLELKLNGYIQTEKDLPRFHSKGIVAGINNVSKRTVVDRVLPCVAPYLEQLEPVAYDSRIPKMVACYFNDMECVAQMLCHSMKNGGLLSLDIGDSQFAGVHIPTHDILSVLLQENGFHLYDEEILRQRRSKNGMVLSQRLLRYRLEK